MSLIRGPRARRREPPLVGSIEELRWALAESLKLQTHYAGILNQYDGGQRRTFDTPDEWVKRLREVNGPRSKEEMLLDMHRSMRR